MAKRTLKHGKRGSRKMGGRKAKKGARKTHRKRGGMAFFRPPVAIKSKAIDWTKPFTGAKFVKLLRRDKVYEFTWEPKDVSGETGTLTLSSKGSQVIGNISTSVASMFGKGLTGKYYDLLKDTVGIQTAESFKERMAENAGLAGASAINKVVFEASDDKVKVVTVYFYDIRNTAITFPRSLYVGDTSELTFLKVKIAFEEANGRGELDFADSPM